MAGQVEASAAQAPAAWPSLNALVCALSPRDAYRRTILSTSEIFCGPDCRDERAGERVRTFPTPAGEYDLAALVRALPPEQRPELLVVKADATGRNFPSNLAEIDCPKVLILGNTQHLQSPIRRMLAYAERERFQFITSDHKRHHLHYFAEAGLANVFWLPGFCVHPHPQPVAETFDHPLLFVGQVGKWHPYRAFLLGEIQKRGLPLSMLAAHQTKAAELYARALVNLNVSLNGDLNLRVFEVLSSGGFLLTDRLSPEAGLEMVFQEGRHLEAFGDVNELYEKASHYLAHPEEARAIAAAGRAEFQRRHRPEQKARELVDAVFANKLPEEYRIEREPRAVHIKGTPRGALLERITIYEQVQELHLNKGQPRVLLGDDVDPRLACDLADLPRLVLVMTGDRSSLDPAVRDLWEKTGTLARIQFQAERGLTDDGEAWDVVIEQHAAPEPTTNEVTLGERSFAAGEPGQAFEHFQKALRADPENVRALNNLGVVSHLFGESAVCLEFLERALSLDRRDPETILNLAEVKLQTGHGDAARRLADGLSARALATPALAERLALLRAEFPPVAPVAAAAPVAEGRRILLVNNIFPPQELGGYGRVMEDFGKILSARGHTVQVLTSDTAYLGPITTPEPMTARTLKLFGGWRDGRLFQLPDGEAAAAIRHNVAVIAAMVEELRPDCCLFGNIDFLGADCLGALLERGVPVVHHLGGQFPGYAREQTPRSPLYRLAAASGWLARKIKAEYPLEEVPIVYPGARVHEFEMPVAPSLGRLRIAFASLLMPYKGAHVLLQALFKLAARGIDFRATLAGGTTQPSWVETLREAIRSAGLQNRIELPGNLGSEELKDLYGRSNVLVFASQVEEAFGITPVEGMASGLAVLSTALGGAAEVVEHGVTGLVFDRQNPDQLAAELLSLVEDRGRWQALAEAGRQRAIERFDIERSVDELERQFTSLVARR